MNFDRIHDLTRYEVSLEMQVLSTTAPRAHGDRTAVVAVFKQGIRNMLHIHIWMCT